MRILVQPERLRQAAQELRRAQEGWQAQSARLRQVFSGLDWESRQQLTVEAQVQQAVSLAESLAARAAEKAAFLEAAAARFEQADAQGAQAIGQVLGAATVSTAARMSLPPWLNDLPGGRLPVTRLVPLAGGGAVTGLGLFASLPWLGRALSNLAEQIWAWLQGRPEKIISPLPEGVPAVPKGRMAQTILSGLERARREQEQKQATSSGQVIQSIEVETPPEQVQPRPTYDVYYPIPPQSQGVRYGKAACLPTAASMILQYYHSQNSAYRTASPDDLIGMLDPGDGTEGKGVVVDRLNDDLGELGYAAHTRTASMEELTTLLKEGPLLANIKVNLTGAPGNGDIQPGTAVHHTVVVKGTSSDAVIINDPWSGKEKVIERAEFEQMWRDGGNWLVIIRPQPAP